MAWRRGVVTMVVVVVGVVVAPKWNEQRQHEPGVSGTREGVRDAGDVRMTTRTSSLAHSRHQSKVKGHTIPRKSA